MENKMEQPTEEQITEIKEMRIQLQHAVKLGKSLQKLRVNPDFKDLIEVVFLGDGLDILWQNIRNLRQEELKGRGSERNLNILEMLDSQVKSRLDFQGFMDTIENDHENAIEELLEMDKEASNE